MATTEGYIDKIKALLAKAESTQYEDEANACYAKALDLMVKHGIDEAMLRANEGRADNVIVKTWAIKAPYSSAKRTLLAQIAIQGFGCQVISDGNSRAAERTLYVVGFESDLESVGVLYVALQSQMMRSLGLAIRGKGSMNGKTFTNSFMVGYASRIGKLLTEQRKATVHDMTSEPGMGLAVIDRSAKIESHVADLWPNLRKAQATSTVRAEAYRAGQNAADNADIRTKVGANVRGALGR